VLLHCTTVDRGPGEEVILHPATIIMKLHTTISTVLLCCCIILQYNTTVIHYYTIVHSTTLYCTVLAGIQYCAAS